MTVGRLLRENAGVQAELARALLARLRRFAGHPLLRLTGTGPLRAARLIAEVGDVRCFRSPDALAALAGVAPIPASSGQIQRMRLNRGGNRRLSRAFYVIATAQSRCQPDARAYLGRRIEVVGKTYREAIRALKCRLVRPVYHLLVEGSLALQMTP
jgi:transposase